MCMCTNLHINGDSLPMLSQCSTLSPNTPSALCTGRNSSARSSALIYIYQKIDILLFSLFWSMSILYVTNSRAIMLLVQSTALSPMSTSSLASDCWRWQPVPTTDGAVQQAPNIPHRPQRMPGLWASASSKVAQALRPRQVRWPLLLHRQS